MTDYRHLFHIPVMGTGHSVDTPIRMAPFGINSVISLVDDVLLEKIRRHYCAKYDLPYEEIGLDVVDGRALRVTAYLDTVDDIVQMEMDAIRREPFFEQNRKTRYFSLLPDQSGLKQSYLRMLDMQPGAERDALAGELTAAMTPGSIDVNIMVKLDRLPFDEKGEFLPREFSDASAALRGFAKSKTRSSVVLSAGINQHLYSYMATFPCFYRDAETGEAEKTIVLKVSDFRSATIQGRFLAKKGLEVMEFRIESGLNCGGHAFPTSGLIMPGVLKEFKEKRDQLSEELSGFARKYYESQGWVYPVEEKRQRAVVSVQGGIGNNGEARRLLEGFGMDLTGWATPFLLVPEATCVDDTTRELLRKSREADLYVSGASPLGVPFNNIHNTGSEIWTRSRAEEGKPGSPCKRGFLKASTEFTEKPICVASSQYQRIKLEELEKSDLPPWEKESLRSDILEKACICNHLGNGALIALGIAEEKNSPQSICPGPNLEWFDRIYTLEEMIDHIYGRGPSLTPAERPHMFVKELVMYVDYLEKAAQSCSGKPKDMKYLQEYRDNLEAGIDTCLEIAQKEPYPGENLASIPKCVAEQKERIFEIFERMEKRLAEAGAA